MRFYRLAYTLTAILVLLTFIPLVYADRGGFSPIRERVFESGQKAIIAWNGTREVLILSTDVSSSSESEVVEIMPLPSNPTISKGEKQSFLKVQDLVNTYFAVTSPPIKLRFLGPLQGSTDSTTPKITITFQDIIGAHYLTVIMAQESSNLIQWLENFLETEGYSKELSSDLKELISDYMKNGMHFFVIDVIKTGTTVKTIDPLIYEFRSPNLYYPLKISALFSGDTEISLFTITNNALNEDSITKMGFSRRAQFQIKQETLAEISPNITQLFSGNPCLSYYRFSGSLQAFESDLLASAQSSPIISAIGIFALNVGIIFLLLLFPANKIGFLLKNVNIPVPKRLEIALLFSGMVGVLLTLVGCFLPWGLVGYGRNGEVLISVSDLSESYRVPAGIVILSMLLAFILAPLFGYSLLTHRNSKETPWILTVGGIYTALLVIIWSSSCLYTLDIGVFTILMGCAFIIFAGLLSFWRMRLIPQDISLSSGKMTFRTYIAKRCVMSIITLIGASFLIFWLWYISGGFRF